MMERAPTPNDSIGTILNDIADNMQLLLRQEVELVKTRTTEKVTEQVQDKAKGVGLLVGGAIFAILGLAFLGVMLLLGLQAWFGLSAWVAALLVTLLYLALGGLLAFLGKQALTPAPDPEALPEEAPALPSTHRVEA